MEGEEALDQQKGAGADSLSQADSGGAENAGVGGKVVDGALNGLARCKGLNVSGQERNLDQRGIVEVLFHALGQGHVRQVEIVVVKVKMDAAEGAGQLRGQGGFAGAGAAGNGQYDGRKGEADAARAGVACGYLAHDSGSNSAAILGTSR
jgi:hypothetical protein